MTADLNALTQRPHLPRHNDHAGDPASLMIAAERELGAFLTAVRLRSGPEAAGRGGDYWMNAFEAADLTYSHPIVDLRGISIAAASRLAKDL